ncbi:MAG TPA: hypothetical protein VF041_23175 [Gemmatimonadaceae bacterium]
MAVEVERAAAGPVERSWRGGAKGLVMRRGHKPALLECPGCPPVAVVPPYGAPCYVETQFAAVVVQYALRRYGAAGLAARLAEIRAWAPVLALVAAAGLLALLDPNDGIVSALEAILRARGAG